MNIEISVRIGSDDDYARLNVTSIKKLNELMELLNTLGNKDKVIAKYTEHNSLVSSPGEPYGSQGFLSLWMSSTVTNTCSLMAITRQL